MAQIDRRPTQTRRARTFALRAMWILVASIAACSSPAPPVEGPTPLDVDAQGDFEALWSDYQRQVPPKAFAFAYDGDDWAWGSVERAADREQARRGALALCEVARAERRIRAACAVYARDSEVVWSLRDHLREFQSYPLHRAFWVAGPRSRPVFDAVLRAASPSAASRQALRDCRDELDGTGIEHTCRICQLDSGIACTDLEQGWPAE